MFTRLVLAAVLSVLLTAGLAALWQIGVPALPLGLLFWLPVWVVLTTLGSWTLKRQEGAR